ncbi:MAG: hypothetical protein JNM70_09805 [Anaerolineae bacterium]|nr:hypothetical protein [Anaerolineae bacterium]
MNASKRSLIVLWKPLAMLILGLVVIAIDPGNPALDTVLAVVGGLLLFGAALAAASDLNALWTAQS